MTIYMKNVTFKVAADDYATQLNSVALNNSVTIGTWQGFNSTVEKNVSAPEWSLDIGVGQDWSEGGFSRYLFEHAGETATVTLSAADSPTFTVDVILSPSNFGGAVNDWANATLSLPVNGQPVLAAA